MEVEGLEVERSQSVASTFVDLFQFSWRTRMKWNALGVAAHGREAERNVNEGRREGAVKEAAQLLGTECSTCVGRQVPRRARGDCYISTRRKQGKGERET